ncbi:MAG: DUF1294 domain-containing protein [Planctomycetota bacterium]
MPDLSAMQMILIALTWYAALSLVTFIAFAIDKHAARRDRSRISERTLHTLELLGGWIGSLAGQRWLRHKSRKRSYRLVLWMIIALHIIGWALIGWWLTQR